MKAALALLAAGAAAAGLLLAVGHGGGGASAPAGIRATVTPAAARFGDLVTARIELLGSARGARVSGRFAPFEVLRARRTPGAWTFTLRCVALACLTSGRTVPVQLPPARVTVGGRASLVPWPAVSLGSRLTPADVARPTLRTDTVAPAPRYRFDPVVAGWLLAALGAALVLSVGVWGAVVLRRRRPRAAQAEDGRLLTPLDRALEALERSLGESVVRRRIALDGVARLLDEAELARRARRLGWSFLRPARDDIVRLLEDCRQERVA